MNKLIILATAAAAGAAHFALAPQGTPVNLQPTSPGTAQTGHLNISGTATVGLLKSQGTVFGQSTAPTGFAYGGFFTAASNQGRGFYGFASSPTGLTYGGFFQNASDSGRAVYGLATSTTGFNYGGYFQSASETGRGVLGVAAATTGVNYGVYGTTASPIGYGVFSEGNMKATGYIVGATFYGNGSGLTSVDAHTLQGWTPGQFYKKGYSIYVPDSLNYSIQITNPYSAGKGVYAVMTSTSGNSDGVYGRSDSTTGRGIVGWAASGTGTSYGMYSRNDSTGGRGLYVGMTATSGATRGISVASNSTGGKGMHIDMNAASGSTVGLAVNSNSPDARCIDVWSQATTGPTYAVLGTAMSTAGYAVFGQALATSGVNYGTVGRSDSPNGWALFSSGRFTSTGTKSFRIDHPFDPEHKYLLHYCSESPSPQNFYSGNITTDERGYAWVILPEYFEEINKNFKYQLTVLDGADSAGFVMAKVSRLISGNKFQIRTSEPRTTVSWRVEADRNDAYVRNRPTSDVEEKVGREVGTYQHPEFYGKPADRGLFYGASQPQGTATASGHSSAPETSQPNK